MARFQAICTAAVLVVALNVAVASAFPTITSVTPSSGSLLGGTRVELAGSDLSSDGSGGITVYIGRQDQLTLCDRIAHYSSSIRIVCQTQAFDGRGDLPITVFVDGVQATCAAPGGSCTFRFTADATPKVSSVRPEVVQAPDVLTFAGSNFYAPGNRPFNTERDFNVLIGDGQRCSIDSPGALEANGFPCAVDAAVPAGANDIAVTLSHGGKADTGASGTDVIILPTVSFVDSC